MHIPTLSLSALLLSSVAAAASALTVAIPPSAILPNPNTLPPSTHATLTTLSAPLPEEQQQLLPLRAPLTRSSTFVFRNLTSSQQGSRTSYLLDIHSRDVVFTPLRVDIGADGSVLGVWEMFRGNGWENKGLEKFTATASSQGDLVTVDARALGKKEFFEQRPKCESFHPPFFTPILPWLLEHIANYDDYSLSPFPLQKPNDSTGGCRSRDYLRNAIPHGQQFVSPLPFYLTF